ncbi:hypothetical protein PLICRDRAFT_42204 [Plicaturopsis crispa FD-325 SS-3]|nr:hypothetical protein PLICRDRAFT_42204 [Plicaturopsis crispa FD-325 SS-3]
MPGDVEDDDQVGFSVLSCSPTSEDFDDDSGSDISDSSLDDEFGRGLSMFPPPPPPQSPTRSHVRPVRPPRPKSPPGQSQPVISSLLSPHRPAAVLGASPARLQYAHHGFSQSALMHQKWLWGSRYDQWDEWHGRLKDAEAYGGMTILPGTCPAMRGPTRPVSRLERDMPAKRESPGTANSNAPIYPRLGDISALRDPYAVNIDRCFCQFSLWSMRKTLFLFDMHHRATDGSNSADDIANRLLAARAHTEEDSFSDADVTLVEDTAQASKSKVSDDGKGFRTWDGVRSWEISWYARWELLVELVKREEGLDKDGVFTTISLSPSSSDDGHADAVASTRPPMFYFAGEDGDEEDEDYGEIVANPLFTRSFAAGFDRSQDFFTRPAAITA